MLLIRNWCLALLLFLCLLLASCSRSDHHQAQGYIEGRYTYIATPVSGVLKELIVKRGHVVEAGQLLFVLEAQPESDAYQASIESLKQSIAARDAIVANLNYAKITFERYKTLVPKNAIQQSALDQARATYFATLAQLTQADANIAQMRATLAASKWTAQQKRVYAPLRAEVFDTYYRLGEYTQANQAILSLLAPQDIKVIFYVNEADLAHLQLGEQVTVRYDHSQKKYNAHISFISPAAEYTPPVIFSEQTSDKLIYRIEASFTEALALHFHPGQPVTVMYAIDD